MPWEEAFNSGISKGHLVPPGSECHSVLHLMSRGSSARRPAHRSGPQIPPPCTRVGSNHCWAEPLRHGHARPSRPSNAPSAVEGRKFSISCFECARTHLWHPQGGSAHLRNDAYYSTRVRGSRKFAPPCVGLPLRFLGPPHFSAEAFLPVNWGWERNATI